MEVLFYAVMIVPFWMSIPFVFRLIDGILCIIRSALGSLIASILSAGTDEYPFSLSQRLWVWKIR